MACTTLLVGKDASFDGSTIMSRSEDSPAKTFTAKSYVLVKAEDQPREYEAVISGQKIDLPDNPMDYTALPNTDKKEGLWAASGVNAKNISMTATETITTNTRVLGADPLIAESTEKEKNGGIGEEDMVTLVLPYISSAREGVERLGALLEKYGTYESNGIGFQDVNEIWWLETIGGHHWMARRVPDDTYVVMPNQLGIDFFDFEDAYGDKENFMCSADLKEWTEENHLGLDQSEDYFNPRLAYGSHAVSDHDYNTPRAWYMLRFFNPTDFLWDGIYADFRPTDDDLPWCLVPERKISVEDMKIALSSHYQGTDYDCYNKHADPRKRGIFRPIGINRDNVTHFTQIRPYVPEEIAAIQWLSFGCNAFNAAVPFYTNINSTPEYVNTKAKKATTTSFYWTNRIIAALVDAHYSDGMVHIERYQQEVEAKGNELIGKYDKAFEENKGDVKDLCEKANQEISDFTEKATNDLLDKVLYSASTGMKNSFARSDN